MTATGQLAIASEFRFDVFHTPEEHQYITVKRGRGEREDKWAIAASESENRRFFDPDSYAWKWLTDSDAYVWDLEPALTLARDLAFEMNQVKIGIMERRFPGQFRGGPYDMKEGEGGE
jgi:hypothetical protein